jgi:hypothetical protein
MRELLHRLDEVKRFKEDDAGGVLIYTAFAISILLGVAGLAVDVAAWQAQKRSIQTTADAAAFAGANELVRSHDKTNREDGATAAAELAAAMNSYVDPDDGDPDPDALTINIPPRYGEFAGATNAVEAIVRRPVPTFLAGLVFDGPAHVSARAVAHADYGKYCVFALNPTQPNALKVSGGANLNLNCGVYVNSDGSGDNALSSPGGGCINATVIRAAGPYNKSGCYNPKPFEKTAPLITPNPFEGMFPVPSEATDPCDGIGNTVVNNGEIFELDSGRHCNKITVQNGGELVLKDGVHVFDGAALTIHGLVHGEVGGDGVNLYYPPGTGSNDALDMASDAEVHLAAPTDPSNPLANVLIYVDEDAGGNVEHTVTAQSTSTLSGMIYMPGQDIKFSGGSNTEGVMIVADEIDLSGQANFDNLGTLPSFVNQKDMTAKLIE